MDVTSGNLKIMVCHHREGRPEVGRGDGKPYLHFHGGRSVYNGTDRALLNMRGDDSGDNISRLNANYNELTVVYWAWKHYDEIGSPEYIGLEHYRRSFGHRMLSECDDYDMTIWDNFLVEDRNGEHTMLDQFVHCHGDRPIKNLYSYLDSFKDGRYEFIKQAFGRKKLYAKNMFIMRKSVFLAYCETLFPIILGMADRFAGNENVRDRSFVSERISSVIFERLSSRYRTRYVEYPPNLPG